MNGTSSTKPAPAVAAVAAHAASSAAAAASLKSATVERRPVRIGASATHPLALPLWHRRHTDGYDTTKALS